MRSGKSKELGKVYPVQLMNFAFTDGKQAASRSIIELSKSYGMHPDRHGGSCVSGMTRWKATIQRSFRPLY